MKKIFYKKVGKRYVAVSEYDSELRDAFSKGTHLVHVNLNSTSYVSNVDPNYAALVAAGLAAKDKMVNALVKGSEAKPKQIPCTPAQLDAWNKLKESFGDQMFSIYFPSANDVAQAGVNALIEEANKLLSNPTVKNAYDQFLLVAKLTKE